MNWNQPLCDDCWKAKAQDRIPYRVIDPPEETCSNCGEATTSGIYIRASVNFRAEDKG